MIYFNVIDVAEDAKFTRDYKQQQSDLVIVISKTGGVHPFLQTMFLLAWSTCCQQYAIFSYFCPFLSDLCFSLFGLLLSRICHIQPLLSISIQTMLYLATFVHSKQFFCLLGLFLSKNY